MASLSRGNGTSVDFQENELLLTLNALVLSNQTYQLVDNVSFFRLGPGSGRLLLADATQANRDMDTVFTFSYDSLPC